MRRTWHVIAWGAAGVALSAALIGGAFALAGSRLTEPVAAVRVTVATEAAPTLDPDPGDVRSSPTASVSIHHPSGTSSTSSGHGDDGTATPGPSRDTDPDGDGDD
jgi:hypothetical protein